MTANDVPSFLLLLLLLLGCFEVWEGTTRGAQATPHTVLWAAPSSGVWGTVLELGSDLFPPAKQPSLSPNLNLVIFVF